MKHIKFLHQSPRYLEQVSRSFNKVSNFPNLLSAETEHMYLLYTLLSTVSTISFSDPDRAKLLDVVEKLRACSNRRPCHRLSCKICSRTQRLQMMNNFSLDKNLVSRYSVLRLNFNSSAISPADFNKDNLICKMHEIDMQLKEWAESTGTNPPIGGVWGFGYYHFNNLVYTDVWVPQVRLILPNDKKLHQDLLNFMLESGEGVLHGNVENNPVNQHEVNTVNDALIAAYDPSWYEHACYVAIKEGLLMLRKRKESSLSKALIDGLLVQTEIDTRDIEILRKSGSIGRKRNFYSGLDKTEYNYEEEDEDEEEEE